MSRDYSTRNAQKISTDLFFSTHEATLRTARPDTPVFARQSAKKRIDNWKIFSRPVAKVRQYNPKGDISALPDTLLQLANRADWNQEVVNTLPEDVSLLWVPTDDWLDGTKDALHGVGIIKFDVPASVDGSQSAQCYTILYSPHGVPASAVSKVFAALNALPRHSCLALIHHFDDIYIPILGGSVFRGLQGGADLAMAIKPKYWIRTHDELKTAEGLISKLQRRVRNTIKEAQDLVSADIKVVELANGESFDLL
ncbi:hypothetical protein P389DRAFT_192864 [Cystobasidium minutum MCA 4210]|uniref:uncharacterized protein n=1 Tax=Cystobasidium minutum MCA 4210 TaxID=1397322 RepID=UPI0034CE6040|eukprot:jgi/Rhomi1/192864/gm1.1078_g